MEPQSFKIDVQLDKSHEARTHTNTKEQLICTVITSFMFLMFLIFINYYNTSIETISLYALFGTLVLFSTVVVVLYMNVVKNRLRILQYNLDQSRAEMRSKYENKRPENIGMQRNFSVVQIA